MVFCYIVGVVFILKFSCQYAFLKTCKTEIPVQEKQPYWQWKVLASYDRNLGERRKLFSPPPSQLGELRSQNSFFGLKILISQIP